MKRVFFPFLLLLLACTPGEGIIKEVAALPLKEVSGIEYSGNALWAIEDSGNKDILYRLSAAGEVTAEIAIANKNKDWEDITSDREGNIYIGDFGNNDNDRNDLAIYKISRESLTGKAAEASSVIKFYYPEQKDFPPKKSARYFDAEAFFEHEGYFYLFTKNRSSGFNGELTVYKVPNVAGRHAAEAIGTLNTCGVYKKCAVTGADISPDGKAAVLLAGDRIWLVTGFTQNSFAGAVMQEHQLGHFSQKEGICFKDEGTLLIADERDKKGGGNLYELQLADIKK